MSMDLIFLHAIVQELRETVRGAAVGKIHQTGPSDLVFRLWTGRENLRLLLSVCPGACRLQLHTGKLPNPAVPPRFCQLLRSRLNRLLEVEREAQERIVRLHFAGSAGEVWTLVAELFGPQPNLVLLDAAGRIVDALQRNGGEGRSILPGKLYQAPEPPARINLAGEFPCVPLEQPFSRWLLQKVSPMTPLLAADLEAAVAAGYSTDQALTRLRERWLSGEFRCGTAMWHGKPILFALAPEFLELSEPRWFAGPSQAAEAFYANQTADELFGGGPDELLRLVRKGLARLEKRQGHIELEQEKTRHYERERELGELLLGNLAGLRRGLKAALVDDWYADPPGSVSIPLDPALSPRENAEAYFKRYRKAKRGKEHIARRIMETREEMDWLEGVTLSLEEAEDLADVAAIRQELVGAGLVKGKPEPPMRRPQPSLQETVRSGRSPGGYQLYWGKHNRSNDYVSRHLTSGEDLWFHAHDLPGCHLVLKRGNDRGEIPLVDVLYAAAVAAGHSRGQQDSKVEVMVARGRAVHKPKQARPGQVSVEKFTTVVVAPLRPLVPDPVP